MIVFFTNIHLALALVFWNSMYLIRNNLNLDIGYSVFLFSGLFFIYNLDRLKGDTKADAINTPLRTNFILSHTKLFVFFTVLSGVTFLYQLFTMQLSIYSYLFLPTFSTFFYWIQKKVFIKTPKISSLLKPTLLGISWGYTMSILPILYCNIPDLNYKVNFASTVLIIFTNGLYYDMRDKEGDLQFYKANVFFVYPVYTLKYFLILPPVLGVIINIFSNHYRTEFFTNLYYLLLGIFTCILNKRPNEKSLDYQVDMPIMLFPLFEIIIMVFLL